MTAITNNKKLAAALQKVKSSPASFSFPCKDKNTFFFSFLFLAPFPFLFGYFTFYYLNIEVKVPNTRSNQNCFLGSDVTVQTFLLDKRPFSGF